MTVMYRPRSAVTKPDGMLDCKLTEMSIRIGVTERKTETSTHGRVFYISAYSRLLPGGNRASSESRIKYALISRGQVPIAVSLGVVGSCRCHLFSFFRLPLFRLKREAKICRRVGEGDVEVKLTEGRWNELGFSISSTSKLTFSPRDLFFPTQTRPSFDHL